MEQYAKVDARNGFSTASGNDNFKLEYGFALMHFGHDIQQGIKTYQRRIERFNELLNSTRNLYLVYVFEDYLYNEDYRSVGFCEAKFKEMVELYNYIKAEYAQTKINIVYFDFHEHQIPAGLPIMNVVIRASKYYNEDNAQVHNKFREYCSDVLKKLTSNVTGKSTGFQLKFSN